MVSWVSSKFYLCLPFKIPTWTSLHSPSRCGSYRGAASRDGSWRIPSPSSCLAMADVADDLIGQGDVIHIYIYVYMNICIWIYVYEYMCIYICASISVYLYVYIYIYHNVCKCVCVCMITSIYIYIVARKTLLYWWIYPIIIALYTIIGD